MKRWLVRFAVAFGVVIFMIALVAADFVVSFRRSVPSYEGVRMVAGLSAPLRITRDAHAIPHIAAASFEEALFGLGYVHAQDRLWQMEMSRRFMQGRLAELFGGEAVSADVEMRTLGLYRASEQALAHLTPATRRALNAYAAGVNAYLAEPKARLPIEFTLAGVDPEPWRPADSVAALKAMAVILSGNANAEAARVKLLSILGKQGLQDFVAPFDRAPLPDYFERIFGGTKVGDRFGIPPTSASNNWVVSGARSASGKPLLANDPHLGLTIPSTWYLAHLASPGEDVVGGTLPGIPAIIGGRNRHIAWGMTNTEPDTQDLFLEMLNPENPQQYRADAEWQDFETRTETIRVRFGGERQITIRASRNGPVMEDEPGSAYEGAVPDGYVYALAWTALAPDDTTLDSILGINRAQDAAAFRTAAARFVTPMQNVVYADDSGAEGSIGLALPGRLPSRSAGLGLVPTPGWVPYHRWGFVPPGEFYQLADPADGQIATANNRTVPETYPHRITLEWDVSYRHDRIDALLAATPAHSIESFKRIQLDSVDTYALTLKPRLMAAAPFAGTGAKAARLLQSWDGAMLRDRPEPLVFTAWTRALARRLYADELGDSFDRYWGYRPEFTLRVLDDINGQSRWCDDKASTETEDCASRIRLALEDAMAELGAAYGDDPSRWRWGDAHISVHAGRPFGGFPLIGRFFNREAVMDGGAFTVLRADHRMGSQRPYAAVHGAGYRGIYDLGDPDGSLYMISTGQSGNLYSRHYDDLLPLWAEGRYVKIPITPQAIANSAAYTLTLQPLSGARLP